jgi:hypothetical protein
VALSSDGGERRLATGDERACRRTSTAAYHGVLGEQLRYICEQAATLDSPQPRGAVRVPELVARVCDRDEGNVGQSRAPNVHAVGFKIGLRKGRRAPDDKLYLQNPDLQENLPRGIIFTRDVSLSASISSSSPIASSTVARTATTTTPTSARTRCATVASSTSSSLTRPTARVLRSRCCATASPLSSAPRTARSPCSARADVDKYKDQCYSFAVEMAECFFEDYYDRSPSRQGRAAPVSHRHAPHAQL